MDKTDEYMGKRKIKSITKYFENIAKSNTQDEIEVTSEETAIEVANVDVESKKVNVKKLKNAFELLMQTGGDTLRKTPVKSVKKPRKSTTFKNKRGEKLP